MAKVDAKRCDKKDCGDLIPADEAVEVTVRYKGAGFPDGVYKMDLCKPCAEADAPAEATFVPRKTSGGSTSEAEPAL